MKRAPERKPVAYGYSRVSTSKQVDTGCSLEVQSSEHARYFKGVDEIRLAGSPGLSSVMLLGKIVGFLNNFQVVVGAIFAELFHQLAESCDREHVGRNLLTQRRHEGF